MAPNLPVIRSQGPASFGGVGTARDLAKLYAELVNPVEGASPLLAPSTAAQFARVQTNGFDLVLQHPSRISP